jgi:transposase
MPRRCSCKVAAQRAGAEQIEALALQHLHVVLPGSLLGKALHYLTAQWPSWSATSMTASTP